MAWNINTSKFYVEVMSSLAFFFGKPEATESELHQSLSEAGTIEQIQKQASDVAEKAVAEKIAALQSEIKSLTDQVADAANKESVSAERIAELEASENDLSTQLKDRDATIISQAEQIKTLSGELATVKASKPVITDKDANDQGMPSVGDTKSKQKSNAMTGEQLFQHFN